MINLSCMEAMVLKSTNSPHTTEFSIIDLFPIPNFKKIQKHLNFGTNLGPKGQSY